MRITSKGQVTIPQDIRERAGLMPGTDVAITYDGRTVEIAKAKKSNRPTRGEQIVRRMRGTATAKLKMTTDEIIKLMRGE
jgi:AbrB family looped-hinge helix DNA binding protein